MRKAGHGSIVAPLVATVAATLAATVAVRVGVAVAKAERDRRAAKARRARERQFALLPEERLADGLRRIALGQLDLAIELLEAGGGAVGAEHAIHETRKALKRVRALIRLLQYELASQAFARESRALRDAGRRLAGARDAEVMVSTLDALLERDRRLARRKAVVKLRRRLLAERERAVEQVLGDAATRAEVLGELRAARVRVAAWTLTDCSTIKTVEPGLRRIYRQGRRGRRRAARGHGETSQAMHQWRKRVKDLRHAAEALERRDPEFSKPTRRGKPGKRKHARREVARRREIARRRDARQIGRVARRADELGELLGTEHDLALLAERVRAHVASRKARKRLLKLIARRSSTLRKQALRDGARLYRRSPKQFVARMRKAYARAARA